MKMPHIFQKEKEPEADAPIPFGYKTSWLCVAARDSGEVEVLIKEGTVTPQEEQIGMGNPLLDPLGEEDWDAYDIPGEESVIELAALWGIDPLFRGEYPKSTGVVCDR